MIRLGFLVTCLVFSMAPQTPSTTDWQGLAPLKSTRMDVERTLGPPAENRNNQHWTYYLPDVVVRFQFSSNPKCQQKLSSTSWDVPPDTLTGIDVTLRHSLTVEETGIDLSKYKKIKGDYDVIGHYYYANTDEGFGLEVRNNQVGGYQYRPGSKHSQLRCERGDQR